MPITRFFASLLPYLSAILLGCSSFYTYAEGFDYQAHASTSHNNGEETILVEGESDFKLSYTRAVKAACKNLLGIDIDQYFSGGQNKRSEVIRRLADLSERTHYNLRLEEEKVALNFTLNL